MIKTLGTIAVLLIFVALKSVNAQEKLGSDLETDTLIAVKSKTEIKLEPGIKFVLDLYEKSYEFNGFRIQIYSGPSKKDAKQIRAKFLRLYNDVASHQTFDAPNFKIRVGDFPKRLEALKFMNEIREHFPNSYLVPDVLEVKNIRSDRTETD